MLTDWTPSETGCAFDPMDEPEADCVECGETFESELHLVDGLCARCDPMSEPEPVGWHPVTGFIYEEDD